MGMDEYKGPRGVPDLEPLTSLTPGGRPILGTMDPEEQARVEAELDRLRHEAARTQAEACSRATRGVAGAKFDAGKVRLGLLPVKALLAVAGVLTWAISDECFAQNGKRYAPHGWKTVENWRERYTDAGLRHFYAYQDGEDYDVGKGGSRYMHLAHLGCCALFLLAKELETKAVRLKGNP